MEINITGSWYAYSLSGWVEACTTSWRIITAPGESAGRCSAWRGAADVQPTPGSPRWADADSSTAQPLQCWGGRRWAYGIGFYNGNGEMVYLTQCREDQFRELLNLRLGKSQRGWPSRSIQLLLPRPPRPPLCLLPWAVSKGPALLRGRFELSWLFTRPTKFLCSMSQPLRVPPGSWLSNLISIFSQGVGLKRASCPSVPG